MRDQRLAGSAHRRCSGFTLVELLVVMAVSGLLITSLLGVVSSSQRLYAVDTARGAINQDVSIALTAITNDARELGEQTNSDFPALVVTGTALSRVLTIRRNLLDIVLPVCKDIKGGSNTDVVFISKNGGDSAPTDCQSSSAAAGFQKWIDYRNANGGTVNAFIYDPVTGLGENFIYDAEDNSGQHIHKSGPNWINDYPGVDNPRVYVLEQHTYSLNSGTLYLTDGTGAPQAYMPNVVSFEVSPYVLNATNTPVAITGDFPPSDKNWKDLTSLQVRLTGTVRAGVTTVQRSFTSNFTPRNVYSADQ